MAPISPISRKRSISPQDEEDTTAESPSKKICKEATLPQTPPPEDPTYIPPNVKMTESPDDAPRQLLMRAVTLALEHVGFTSASREAMEAFCSEVDSYAEVFLSQITSAMVHARRSQPTPLDFEYALKQFSLPMASLEPHLKHPIPTSKVQIRLEPAPDKVATFQPGNAALAIAGGELSGESDKNARQYIPKHFPSFPSKHTYKWTEQEPKRETDARKIREEASVQARQGEDALRRLTAVSKAGKEKGVKQAAGKDPKSKQRHDLWEQTMGGLLASNQAGFSRLGEVDKSMIVNANKSHHRKGAIIKRKQPPQLPADLFST